MSARVRGLTLLEIMIAVAITAIIGVMLTGAFHRSAVAKELVEADDERVDGARLALGRMAREISMAYLSEHYDHKRFRDRPTLFRGREQGGSDTLVLTTFAHARLERDAKESDTALVEYRLETDPQRSGEYVLTRREKPHIDDEPDRGGASAALCDHVSGLEIRYWDWKRQEWVREWSSSSVERQGQLPTRVRVKLTLKMQDGREQPFTTQARVAIIRPLDF